MTVSDTPLPPALSEPPPDPDKVKPQKRPWWIHGLRFLYAFAKGLALGVGFVAALRFLSGETLGAWWVLLPTVMGVVLLSVVAHELGHVLGGRLGGWRPFLFIVGPLRLRFGERLHVSWGRLGPGLLGMAASLPPAHAGTARSRGLTLMLLGGPVANLLLVLLGLLALLGLGDDLSAFQRRACAVLVLVNGFFAVVNLLPVKFGGFLSDGYQLRQAWQGDPAVHERLAMTLLQAQALAGRRPRDWDAGLVQTITQAQADPQARLTGPLFSLAVAWDHGHSEAAAEAALRYAERLHSDDYAQTTALLRRALLLPMVVYLAEDRGDPAAAQRWWDAALALMQGMAMPHDELHAEAALTLAQGDRKAAAELARRGLEAIAASGLLPAALTFTAERLQAIARADAG
jgi:hypothetical protein